LGREEAPHLGTGGKKAAAAAIRDGGIYGGIIGEDPPLEKMLTGGC